MDTAVAVVQTYLHVSGYLISQPGGTSEHWRSVLQRTFTRRRRSPSLAGETIEVDLESAVHRSWRKS